jgi:hypothetical protein
MQPIISFQGLKCYTSVCSEISSASSTSMPRYRTVLSSFVWPSSNCTVRRFFVVECWAHGRLLTKLRKEPDFHRSLPALVKRKKPVMLSDGVMAEGSLCYIMYTIAISIWRFS